MSHPRRRATDRTPATVSNQRVVFEELGVDRDPSSLLHQEMERMLAAVQRAGVVHMINHNYRRVPAGHP